MEAVQRRLRAACKRAAKHQDQYWADMEGDYAQVPIKDGARTRNPGVF